MRTVADQWASFRAIAYPPHLPASQERELRRTFYAGFTAALGIVLDLGNDDVSEDAGVGILEGLRSEVQAFSDAVANGRS